jgi:hypothetical protein
VEEKASRRPRLLLIVTGVLALVMAANCIAIAVHISSLRATAASSSGDAVPELLAQADDFRPAETIFLVFASSSLSRS